MIVRCGNCRAQFDVKGVGRFTCPSCGSVNMVRGAETPPSSAVQTPNGAPAAPTQPSPRVSCAECGFSFIVGRVTKASCPNCGTEVETGITDA